jgi:hypothetical protein
MLAKRALQVKVEVLDLPMSNFHFSHFSYRVLHFLRATLDHVTYTYASCTAGMSGVHHEAQLIIEMQSH